MSIYEARLQADLEAISRQVDAVGALVVEGVEEAVEALLAGDRLRSYRVGLSDKAINRRTRATDAKCHEFVARHFPAAGHLRFISSVLRLDVALERVGDYAVNIARRSVQLDAPIPEPTLRVVRTVGETAISLLQEALLAWSMRDAEAARTLIRRSRAFTRAHERSFDDLVVAADGTDIETLFVVRDILSNLIRVAAQARNLGEETVFTTTGHTKEPKVYPVLFVGDGANPLVPLAEAFARKAFPTIGDYRSATWSPAQPLPEPWTERAAAAGLDFGSVQPGTMEEALREIERYEVVVALEEGALSRLGNLPYSTVFLQWPLPLDGPVDALKEVSSQVRDLMIALRGPDAG